MCPSGSLDIMTSNGGRLTPDGDAGELPRNQSRMMS